ncbi:MAG: hypothetical protein V3T11_07810 [Roseateles sp.]
MAAQLHAAMQRTAGSKLAVGKGRAAGFGVDGGLQRELLLGTVKLPNAQPRGEACAEHGGCQCPCGPSGQHGDARRG